jgi:CheY-like chemotaxis protein
MPTQSAVTLGRLPVGDPEKSFMWFMYNSVEKIGKMLNGRNGRVLVVTPDKSQGKMLHSFLTNMHFNVQVVHLGVEGLKALDRGIRAALEAAAGAEIPEDYRIVLFDASIPDVDFASFAYEVSELGSGATVLSLGGLGENGDPVVESPVDLRRLRITLQQMFDIK